MNLILCLTLSLAAAAPALATQPAAAPADAATAVIDLDFLGGNWDLFDAAGKKVGDSTITVHAPGAALFELRTADGGEGQPLWFFNSERDKGWVQLFLGPSNQARAFTLQSPPNSWPLVLGADVVLRDGTPARFRMTMTRASADLSRRKLEMSRDQGATWSTVFDYEYRRRR
jgi:hypothetical protein